MCKKDEEGFRVLCFKTYKCNIKHNIHNLRNQVIQNLSFLTHFVYRITFVFVRFNMKVCKYFLIFLC